MPGTKIVRPWLCGPPGTGKSTFATLLQTALDPTGKVIDASLLSGDRDTERLDAELLKMMAGTDRIPGRVS